VKKSHPNEFLTVIYDGMEMEFQWDSDCKSFVVKFGYVAKCGTRLQALKAWSFKMVRERQKDDQW
jgi:hypothetical protein